jgi:hypothetical protein
MRFAPILALAFGAAITVLTPAGAADQRVNASYNTVTTRDVAACARACADDGLCVAWMRQASGACDLIAVAPTAPAPDGASTGLSSRAPSFAAWPAPLAPTEVTAPAAQTQPAVVHEPETEVTLLLLGGPEDNTLRPRLGARQ